MTWTLRRLEEFSEGLFSMIREIASNEEGVSIETWGSSLLTQEVLFKYVRGDIVVQFGARRSSRSADAAPNDGDAPVRIGPVCDVWIDDRSMRFTTAEWVAVKANIIDFFDHDLWSVPLDRPSKH
jgi:hypothetical protein